MSDWMNQQQLRQQEEIVSSNSNRSRWVEQPASAHDDPGAAWPSCSGSSSC
jgi:hypothetical protein